MTRDELIAKVEGLTGPDRDVDAIIGNALRGENFTGSVDAVLALIKKRLPTAHIQLFIQSGCHADIWDPDRQLPERLVSGDAATPAAALLAVYLRAEAATPAAREEE